MRNAILLGAALAVATPLLAQGDIAAPGQTAQGDVAVTIYNNNRALVQDRRVLNLPAGRSRQEFRDVSAQIQPETVTLGGRGIGIVEQNFDFDLLSPAALIQNAVGETVTLVRVNPATGAGDARTRPDPRRQRRRRHADRRPDRGASRRRPPRPRHLRPGPANPSRAADPVGHGRCRRRRLAPGRR